MVRAAIVGIGRWGKIIVESVQSKSDHITFVAGHTRTRTKAEDFCHEQNIDLHDDLDAILKDPTIDAVVFATPHLQHEEQVKRAAQAGKHIYVEKPFTLNVRSARAALDAVNQAGWKPRYFILLRRRGDHSERPVASKGIVARQPGRNPGGGFDSTWRPSSRWVY